MIIEEETYLEHYGILRRSGRYPWNSGSNSQDTRNRTFLEWIKDLRSKGLSETEIARGIEVSTTTLRAAQSIANNQQRQARINNAQKLKEKGMSNVAIGQQMGLNESTVRSLLAPGASLKADILTTTTNMLKDEVAAKGFIDVGKGVENHVGVSNSVLRTAVAAAREDGYELYYLKTPQLGTKNETSIKVLAAPGTSYSDVSSNREKLGQINQTTDDSGRTFFGIQTPIAVNPARVSVVYGPDGGADADGVIYVRRGADGLSMGNASYAQVRIQVGDGHYLKGMAVYRDDLPAGTDLLFNTNKTDSGNKFDSMKPLVRDPATGKVDKDNPFGAVVKQLGDLQPDGSKKLTSAMNLVNEEGDWNKWSKTLSTQMLSKQKPQLARQQLDMVFERKRDEYNEIMALTNPAVRKKLLQEFSDGAEASSVHMKAAALPRQRSQVILPINSLRDNQVYAPNFKDGERVVLIRYPHGGTFEIPELVVNNRNREAKGMLGVTQDAIGINSRVAERMSGADFDGDTVLVIPNDRGRVQTSSALAGLQGFDPRGSYPAYEGMPKISPKEMQSQMGKVSNLITDMTIRKAPASEIARAVRHSMVVIDAEKHNLDYKTSAQENGISALKIKYQGGPTAGATTIVSLATSPVRVDKRKPRPASEGGPIDPTTGKRVYVNTGDSYINKKGVLTKNTTESKRLLETDDAATLSSGTPIEAVYVNHSNRLKALSNRSRKDYLETPNAEYSPSAAKTYQVEVKTLTAKLNTALQNAPRERQAQILASAVVKAKADADPFMEKTQRKRIEAQALAEARTRTNAKKERVNLSDPEWAAIQAGAISHTKLTSILDNADMDRVRELATPRVTLKMTSAKTARAQSMLDLGYTRAEVAGALGVSLTTLDTVTGGEDG